MSSDRAAQVLGAGLAALWLVVLVSVDLAIPGETAVLAPLFAVAPLIACVVLPARATAAVAAAAVAATIASGWWNHTWGTAQHLVGVVDVLLVGGVAVFVAVVLLRQAQRHARVAEIAEVAQRTILPTLPSLVGQVALAARYQSAAQDATVGGDLYDCYHSAGRVRFLVGDVRGKGIAAVEQSARVIRAFRQSAGTKTLLSTLAQDMSEYLAPFFDDEEFVTALLVDASEPTQITLVSCGHPPAMLIRPDGRTFFLEAPAGLPLGLGDMYDAVTVPWAPGDRLLMYTDGLSEARNVWGQFLDLPSLVPLLTAEPVEDALNAVLHAVRHHVPSGRLTDDLAVMLLENTAAPAAPVDPGPAAHELPFPAGPGPTMTTLFPRTIARAQ
jgi:sigma-B regulation protein RsbU (phosphoserine phosphatase)